MNDRMTGKLCAYELCPCPTVEDEDYCSPEHAALDEPGEDLEPLSQAWDAEMQAWHDANT